MRKIKAGAAILIILLVLSLSLMGKGSVDSSLRLSHPSLSHPFGCDSLGRDLLERTSYGTVVSLGVGLLSSTIAVLASLVLVVSAVGNKTLSSLLMGFVSSFRSIPSILAGVLFVSISGGRAVSVILALAVTGAASSTRVLMAKAMETEGEEYILALSALGIREWRKRIFHILPSLFPYAREEWTSLFMSAIITESSMSYLGAGIDPSVPTLGAILSEGRHLMFASPHVVLFPSIVLVATGVALMLISRGISELYSSSH
ncbi:MAG: ABC transporter permease [Candidatus Ornithospirochaeta sp.]